MNDDEIKGVVRVERSQRYLFWQETDKKTLKRVNMLLKDVARKEVVG